MVYVHNKNLNFSNSLFTTPQSEPTFRLTIVKDRYTGTDSMNGRRSGPEDRRSPPVRHRTPLPIRSITDTSRVVSQTVFSFGS